MSIQEWLKRLFGLERPQPSLPIKAGLYHAMREAGGGYSRFHLRVESDGSGMLIANAMAAARLSPSGTVIVKGLLDGKNQAEILDTLTANFKGASEAVMQEDIAKVNALIEDIATPGDTYPIFNLEDPALSPHTAQLIAPLQAAVPLAPPEQLVPIIDQLWEVGIPHITLLVPPAPEAAYLIRAVERAEDLGMIAGVRGRASDLYQGTLLNDLAQAGVDHVTFIYASDDPAIHDVLCGTGDHAAATTVITWLEDNQICAVAEIPLIEPTLDTLKDTVNTIIAKGADNLSFVAIATTDESPSDGAFAADAMPQVATLVEETAHEAQARFIWEPPIQRNPAKLLTEQIQEGPRCSADVAVRVEPDGSVIPPRGPYRSAGNLLHDTWESIWKNEAFKIYRERVEAPTRCDRCPGLTICAADCPRKPAGWSQYA